MDDTEGVSFPGVRPITEPTIVALPGPGTGIVYSGVCEPKRNGPKIEQRRGKKKTTSKAKRGGKKSKKGTSKKKK